MADRLFDLINAYAKEGFIPFHMPGHKRMKDGFLSIPGANYDITELPDFDDLHDPHGILKESMTLAQSVFRGKRVYYLTGGSTAGILASVYACCPRGSCVIMARNCHISVYNAVEMNGLQAEYLYPDFDEKYSIYTSVTPEKTEEVLKKSKNISAVIVTSPTYDGVVSDIVGIADAAHRYGALLIVDAAHGAHFGFSTGFPAAAQGCGADIVITSLHKTLPALTGSAAAIINNENIFDKFDHAFSIFESTSPSYLLLSSIDACVRLLHEHKAELFCNYSSLLDEFNLCVKGLKNIEIIDSVSSAYGLDPGKILIFGKRCSGKLIYDLLRKEKIEPEMYGIRHTLCMTSICDTKDSFDKLANALYAIDEMCVGDSADFPAPPAMEQDMITADALKKKKKSISIEECVGMISGEYVYAYPPGSPVLAPGEIISEDFMRYYCDTRGSGLRFRHTSSGNKDTFTVISSV